MFILLVYYCNLWVILLKVSSIDQKLCAVYGENNESKQEIGMYRLFVKPQKRDASHEEKMIKVQEKLDEP